MKTIPIELTPAESERFWAKVTPGAPDACWNWSVAKTRDGYGQFSVNRLGTAYMAHRVTYSLLVGPIAPGLTIDHLCRNTSCVNPAHLEPVTSAENTRRAHQWHKEHGSTRYASAAGYFPPWVTSGKNVTGYCIHGHEYTDENTYTYRDGRTDCRTCKSARRRTRPEGVIPRRIPQHGDRSMYRRGCRCGSCKQANTAYVRSLRERRSATR